MFKEAILEREVPGDRRHGEVWRGGVEARRHGACRGKAFLPAREGRELNRGDTGGRDTSNNRM